MADPLQRETVFLQRSRTSVKYTRDTDCRHLRELLNNVCIETSNFSPDRQKVAPISARTTGLIQYVVVDLRKNGAARRTLSEQLEIWTRTDVADCALVAPSPGRSRARHRYGCSTIASYR